MKKYQLYSFTVKISQIQKEFGSTTHFGSFKILKKKNSVRHNFGMDEFKHFLKIHKKKLLTPAVRTHGPLLQRVPAGGRGLSPLGGDVLTTEFITFLKKNYVKISRLGHQKSC